jgi:Gas vesicle synthesis protein GvpO
MRKLIVLSAALGALAVPSVAAAQDPAAPTKPKEQVHELTGHEHVSVSGLAQVDGGWEIMVDVVELRRVSDTASPLATYSGTARASRLIREQDLVAVVSDPPRIFRKAPGRRTAGRLPGPPRGADCGAPRMYCI